MPRSARASPRRHATEISSRRRARLRRRCAVPQVSHAQKPSGACQSHGHRGKFSISLPSTTPKRSRTMTGGRLKIDVLAAVPWCRPFQMPDAVHTGILDGGHGVAGSGIASTRPRRCSAARHRSAGTRTASCRGSTPAAAKRCTRELLNGILKLNLVGLLYFPMPAQPLGWFKKRDQERRRSARGELSHRRACRRVFKALGAAVTILPSGEIVGGHRPRAARCRALNNPAPTCSSAFPKWRSST